VATCSGVAGNVPSARVRLFGMPRDRSRSGWHIRSHRRCHGAQQADRHQVARAHQRIAQARRAADAPPSFSGRQVCSMPLSATTIGASMITLAGGTVLQGAGIQERLNPEPGWRRACVTWFQALPEVIESTTSATTAPSCGSSATSAPLRLRHLGKLRRTMAIADHVTRSPRCRSVSARPLAASPRAQAMPSQSICARPPPRR